MNSPSRHIFEDIPSIIQCDHDPYELYNTMVNASFLMSGISYEDRLAVIDLFSIVRNVEKFENVIRSKKKITKP